MNQSQLAFVALETEKYEAELAKKRQELTRYGGGINATTTNNKDSGKAREKAAKKVGSSPRYVQDAKKIARESPEKAAQIKSGKKTITQAKREIKEENREKRRQENKRRCFDY